MAKIARGVIPGSAHHVTQRGNHRQQTFFCDEDFLAYIDLMGEWCRTNNVAIWGWCLVPNHVHLIAVPANAEGLARAIGGTPDASFSVNNGGGTCGRSDSPPFP